MSPGDWRTGEGEVPPSSTSARRPPDDPAQMSAEARLAELAGALADGLLRLRTRTAGQAQVPIEDAANKVVTTAVGDDKPAARAQDPAHFAQGRRGR